MVVQSGNTFSNIFRTSLGVRQGGIASPRLFTAYTDDLLCEVENLEVGLEIGTIKIDVISYADDIILVSTTKSGAQAQLNVLTKYGKRHCIKWNPIKTELIIFNKDIVRTNIEVAKDSWQGDLSLSGGVITEVNDIRYLGAWLNNMNNNSTHLNNRKKAFFSAKAKITNLGLTDSCLHPLTRVKMYPIYLRSMLLYGSECYSFNDNEIGNLSKLESNCIKDLAGLSRRCHNTNILSALRITSTEKQLKINKLNAYVRLNQNSYTRTIIQSLENDTSLKNIETLLCNEINRLIVSIPKYEYRICSSSLGTLYKPQGKWDREVCRIDLNKSDRCLKMAKKLQVLHCNQQVIQLQNIFDRKHSVNIKRDVEELTLAYNRNNNRQ